MPAVTLYTRNDCHLCEEAADVLREARRRAEFQLDIVDIDENPELKRRYDREVPVITVDGRKAFKHRLTLEDFLEELEAES
jgi:glutaredoxin